MGEPQAVVCYNNWQHPDAYEDDPIKGLPSIRFDMRLSRESAVDKIGGRVGADPSAILKPPPGAGNGPSPIAASAAS